MDTIAILVYAAVAVSSAMLITGTVRARRREVSGPVYARTYDLLEAAFLAGGPGRVADTVISAMYADRRLAIGGPGVVSVRRPVARGPVEEELLRLAAGSPHGALTWLRRELMRSTAVQEIGDRLAGRGLMVRPDALRFWRRMARVQTGLCAVGAFLAIVISIGSATDGGPPLIFMIAPALFIGFFVGGSCAGAGKRRLTAAGRRALVAYRRESGVSGRHVRARSIGHPATVSVAVVVALTGAAALTDDPLLRAHLLDAQKVPGGSGSSGHSGSSGDSGVSVSDSGGSWCGGGGGSSCGGSSCGGGGGGGCGGGSGCGGGGGGGCGGG